MIYFCCWLILSMHCHSCLLRGIIPALYPLHNKASLNAVLSVILPTIMNLYWLQCLFPPALSLRCSLASASRIHNELLKSVTIPIISHTAALWNLCITSSMQLRERVHPLILTLYLLHIVSRVFDHWKWILFNNLNMELHRDPHITGNLGPWTWRSQKKKVY